MKHNRTIGPPERTYSLQEINPGRPIGQRLDPELNLHVAGVLLASSFCLLLEAPGSDVPVPLVPSEEPKLEGRCDLKCHSFNVSTSFSTC